MSQYVLSFDNKDDAQKAANLLAQMAIRPTRNETDVPMPRAGRQIIGGGGGSVGELGWGTPLSSMSPLTGAMVTKARTYPENDLDRYRRDIVYLGEEWENCIVREDTPFSYIPGRTLESLPRLNSSFAPPSGLANLAVVSPNYLSPLPATPMITSSSYLSTALSDDASKYTITWQDYLGATPRRRYKIDIMSSRSAFNIQSAATSASIEWNIPDLFCLYMRPIDTSGLLIPEQYANSTALFYDPSALQPVDLLQTYLEGGADSDNPTNMNGYLGGSVRRYVQMYIRPNTLPVSLPLANFMDLFTVEYKVNDGVWTSWLSATATSAQSYVILYLESVVDYNIPYEFSLRCTSRTTGRTQYSESKGWFVVTK